MFFRIAFLLVLSTGLLQAQELAPLYTLYKNGQNAQVLARTVNLLREHGDNAELNQLHGRALVDSGSPREALPFLAKAVEKDEAHGWISGWSLLYLSQARFLTDDYEGARHALKQCIALRATENVTTLALRFQFAIGQSEYFGSWSHTETEHLRLHIQGKIDEAQLKTLADAREKAFVEILAALGGGKLPKKIDFFIWQNRLEPMEKFRMNLPLADPMKSCVYSTQDATIGHELTHVITHHLTPLLQANKVSLINEGVAVWFARDNKDNLAAARTFIERHMLNKLSIQDLWKNWAKYPEGLSHPIAGIFVGELLTRFGADKFRRLLLDQSYENARLVYGPQLDVLIHEFEQRLLAKQL